MKLYDEMHENLYQELYQGSYLALPNDNQIEFQIECMKLYGAGWWRKNDFNHSIASSESHVTK